jgi:CRISPR-associated protein Csy2
MTEDLAHTVSTGPWMNEEFLLTLPRLRIQNANSISSPLTWGFPAMTAFLGVMTALERRMGRAAGLRFTAVGVVCHAIEPQVTTQGFGRTFRLTRNPVDHAGDTSAIVEEGRTHLNITLLLACELRPEHAGDEPRRVLADQALAALHTLRVAGGSVVASMGPDGHLADGMRYRPTLEPIPTDPEEAGRMLRRIARRALPGFTLVLRDDLLKQHAQAHAAEGVEAAPLDDWLELIRWNHRAVPAPSERQPNGAEWRTDPRLGWTVPIPVGYGALSGLYAPGTVANARDTRIPFRFVETLWSIGQWISPHRLRTFDDLFWYAEHDPAQGTYRCRNDHAPELPQT